MHRKDISNKALALEKGISQLIDVLSEIDMNGSGSSSIINDDGSETILSFTTEGTGEKAVGVYTLTIGNSALNTTVQQRRTLTDIATE